MPAARVDADLAVRPGWIAALAVVALVLRGIGLDGGLWLDEIYSLLDSFRPPLAQIVTVFPRDNHHPLYSVLAHLSLAGLGEAAWTIRLPALLFGVASVPMLYLLGGAVTTRREALAAAALLAVSYHHVWFSQNARGYTALAFFTLLATWSLLRGLDTRRRRHLAGYALAIALGAYVHLTMVFVAVGHAAVVAARNLARDRAGRRWRDGSWPWLALGLAALLTLVLYAPVLAQVQHYFVRQPTEMKGISTPAWAAAEGIRVLMQGVGAGTGLLAAAVVAAAALLFVAGIASYARSAPLALALFVVPAAAIVAGALVARGTMYPRFFFALIGFGLLIGVRGVTVAATALARRFAPRHPSINGPRLAALALVIAGALSLASLVFNYRYPKQDFAGARDWIVAHRGADEPVATLGAARTPYQRWLAMPWQPVGSEQELAALRAGAARTWAVYTMPRYLALAAPGLWQAVRRDCATARVFRGTVGDGDVVVCTFDRSVAKDPAEAPR